MLRCLRRRWRNDPRRSGRLPSQIFLVKLLYHMRPIGLIKFRINSNVTRTQNFLFTIVQNCLMALTMEDETTKELAKTTDNIVNLSREFGAFLADTFGPAIEDIGEIVHYKTQYWKARNAISFKRKVAKLIEENTDIELKHARSRIGVPLIESAIAEDNEKLQDMWASLLVSELVNPTGFRAKRGYIETLKQLEPEDAKLTKHLIEFFRDSVISRQQKYALFTSFNETTDIWISLRNLERLGIIKVFKVSEEDIHIGTGRILIKLIAEDAPNQDQPVYGSAILALTTFGYYFLRSVEGYPLIPHKKGEYVPIDWADHIEDGMLDAFIGPPKSSPVEDVNEK